MSGGFHRVALHLHSSWSYDGRWRLGSIARLANLAGLDAALMTEHDDTFDQSRFDAYRVACAQASTSACRLVPGIEYSGPDNDVHILTWGVDHFLGARRPVAEILAHVAQGGGVAVLAHPRRRDVWRSFDPAWAPLLHGVEIWNRKSDGIAPFDPALDIAARTGLPPLVGVDFHRLNQLWPLHCRVPAASGDVEADALAALRKGLAEPCAFGAPLRDAGGAWRSRALAAHGRAEALRRRVKRLLSRGESPSTDKR